MLLVKIVNVNGIFTHLLGVYGLLDQTASPSIFEFVGRVGDSESCSQRVDRENYTIIGEVLEIGVDPTEQVTCMDDLRDGDEIIYRLQNTYKVLYCEGFRFFIAENHGYSSIEHYNQDMTYRKMNYPQHDVMKVIRKGQVVFNRDYEVLKAKLEQAVLDLQLASQVRDIQDEKIDKLKTNIKELQYELNNTLNH